MGTTDEYSVDVLDLEEPETNQPRISRRKIIMVAAFLLIIFLIIASLSGLLFFSLFSGDSAESTSNEGPAPSPKPTAKPDRPIDLDDWYSEDGIVLGQAPPPFPLVSSENLRNTSEYQISLNMTDVGNNRTVIITKILSILSNFTGLPFDANNGEDSVRNQYAMKDLKTSCVDNPEIRVRDYLTGPKTGGTTVDIKGNSGSNKQISVDFPYYPGPAFPDSPYSEPEGNPAPASFQKVEKDVHPCSFKFSRETRIFFEYPVALQTCHDLLHMYPWAFPNMTIDQQNNTINAGSQDKWWVLEHSAYLFSSPGKAGNTQHPGVTSSDEGGVDTTKNHSGTRCESTFTLQYPTVQDALDGVNPMGGEWSLRIYSTNDGLGDWDGTVVSVVDAMYQQMLLQVGDPAFPCKP